MMDVRCRAPLVTAEEAAALFGRQPRTVRQELEAILVHQPYASGDRARPTATLRRLIAQALHGAAEAIFPAAR